MTDRHPITWYEETRRILEAERSGASARCPLTRSRCLELLDELDAYRTPPRRPAPSTPGEGTPARDVADAVDSCPGCEAPLWPDNLTSCWNCGQALIDYGPKFRTPPPGEGTGRPGGWVEGVGWVALLADLDGADEATGSLGGESCRADGVWHSATHPVIVTRWADGTTPAPPASPADDVPDADAVAFQNGYRIGVRVGSEHHGPCRGLPPASPVPPTPTPTPCPYIVTGGEGTSYCSLAEQTPTPQADRDKLEIDVEELLIDHCGMGGTSALTDRILALTDALTFAAAPPSTPADPHPTDLTGSEA